MTTLGRRSAVSQKRRVAGAPPASRTLLPRAKGSWNSRLHSLPKPSSRPPRVRIVRPAGLFAKLLALALLSLARPASAQPAQPLPRPGAEAEVRAAVSETLDAWSSGDFERLAAHYHEDVRGFFLQGAALARGFNAAALEIAYEAGLRAEVSVRDLDVQIHGLAAASVAYVDGAVHLPGGQPSISGTWRYSETRLRTEDGWKIVQYHFSRLAPPPPG